MSLNRPIISVSLTITANLLESKQQRNCQTTLTRTSTSVGTDLYPHMPILRPHAARHSTDGASLWVTFTSAHLYGMFTCVWAWPERWTNRPTRGSRPRGPRVSAWPARWPIRPISGFWEAKFTKIGDSLPLTPMNRRAKCDAAALSSAEKPVAVQINKQTNKQ